MSVHVNSYNKWIILCFEAEMNMSMCRRGEQFRTIIQVEGNISVSTIDKKYRCIISYSRSFPGRTVSMLFRCWSRLIYSSSFTESKALRKERNKRTMPTWWIARRGHFRGGFFACGERNRGDGKWPNGSHLTLFLWWGSVNIPRLNKKNYWLASQIKV